MAGEGVSVTPRLGRTSRLVIAILMLAPLAFTCSLFIWTEEGWGVAIDSALSLGLGSPVAGTVRFEGCQTYVDGDYPGSRNVDRGSRCEMIIEASGQRVQRPIDLDHPDALREVRQPGTVFGALGAAMPGGVLFDRLGKYGTLIAISFLCLGGLIYGLWPRRRPRSPQE